MPPELINHNGEYRSKYSRRKRPHQTEPVVRWGKREEELRGHKPDPESLGHKPEGAHLLVAGLAAAVHYVVVGLLDPRRGGAEARFGLAAAQPKGSIPSPCVNTYSHTQTHLQK